MSALLASASSWSGVSRGLRLGDGLAKQRAVQRRGARIFPQGDAGRLIDPFGIAAQKSFTEGHEPRALIYCLLGEGGGIRDAGFDREGHRAILNNGNRQQ